MASHTNVESEAKAVHGLFKENVVYSMPLFQRGYVWKEENLEEYWEDLKILTELGKKSKETSFLGALVLQEDESGDENNITLERYIVIDGQQRLTTFYLTLLALLVYAIERVQLNKQKGKVNEDDRKGWKNYANDQQHREYLFSHQASNPEEVKLKPSRSDHPQFNSILDKLKDGLELIKQRDDEKSPELLSDGEKEKDGNLSATYQKLYSKIEFFIEVKDDTTKPREIYSKIEQRKRYDKIRHALVAKTEVVQIITGSNPNVIFDRLNTTGVPLGTFDWVRNDVFRRLPLKKNKGVEDKKFSTEIWMPFEKELKDVSEITELKILKEDEKYYEEEQKKYDTEEQNRKASQSDYFFVAYGTTNEVKDFSVKNKIKRLKEHWNGEIKNYKGKQGRYGGAKIIIDSLEKYLPSYLALCAEKKPDGIDLELWRVIDNMKEISFPPLTYPFLMPVIRSSMQKGGLPAASAIQAFKIVDSFLVRLTLAGEDTRRMSPVFKNLWKECEEEKMKPELIWQKIKTKKTDLSFLEDDDEIKKRILNESIDNTKDRVKYILMQYEKKLRKNHPAIKPLLHKCEIDHIMPKAESKAKGPQTNEKEKGREDLCGTLGNLTLLDPKINRLKSAKGFKKELKEESSQEDIKGKKESVRDLLKKSDLRSVKELLKDFDKGEDDSWGLNSIKNRGDKLADWAIERWPLVPEKFYPQNTQAKRAKPKSRRKATKMP